MGPSGSSPSRTPQRQRTRNGRVSTRMPMNPAATATRTPMPANGIPESTLRPPVRTQGGIGGGSGGPPTIRPNTAPSAPGGGSVANTGRSLATRPNLPELRMPSAATVGRAVSRVATNGLAAASLLVPDTTMEQGADFERAELRRQGAGFDVPSNIRNNSQETPTRTSTEVTVTAPRNNSRATPSRSQGASRNPTPGLTTDRLNELSLAMAQGRTPETRSASEAVAVERMKGIMEQNKAARGGVMAKPMSMPSVKPKARPTTPKAKAPVTPGKRK